MFKKKMPPIMVSTLRTQLEREAPGKQDAKADAAFGGVDSSRSKFGPLKEKELAQTDAAVRATQARSTVELRYVNMRIAQVRAMVEHYMVGAKSILGFGFYLGLIIILTIAEAQILYPLIPGISAGNKTHRLLIAYGIPLGAVGAWKLATDAVYARSSLLSEFRFRIVLALLVVPYLAGLILMRIGWAQIQSKVNPGGTLDMWFSSTAPAFQLFLVACAFVFIAVTTFGFEQVNHSGLYHLNRIRLTLLERRRERIEEEMAHIDALEDSYRSAIEAKTVIQSAEFERQHEQHRTRLKDTKPGLWSSLRNMFGMLACLLGLTAFLTGCGSNPKPDPHTNAVVVIVDVTGSAGHESISSYKSDLLMVLDSVPRCSVLTVFPVIDKQTGQKHEAIIPCEPGEGVVDNDDVKTAKKLFTDGLQDKLKEWANLGGYSDYEGAFTQASERLSWGTRRHLIVLGDCVQNVPGQKQAGGIALPEGKAGFVGAHVLLAFLPASADLARMPEKERAAFESGWAEVFKQAVGNAGSVTKYRYGPQNLRVWSARIDTEGGE